MKRETRLNLLTGRQTPIRAATHSIYRKQITFEFLILCRCFNTDVRLVEYLRGASPLNRLMMASAGVWRSLTVLQGMRNGSVHTILEGLELAGSYRHGGRRLNWVRWIYDSHIRQRSATVK